MNFTDDFNPEKPINEWPVKYLLCCRQRLLESANDPELMN